MKSTSIWKSSHTSFSFPFLIPLYYEAILCPTHAEDKNQNMNIQEMPEQ